MDRHRVDAFSRFLSQCLSRRGVLGGLTSGLLAVLALALDGEEDAAAKNTRRKGKKKHQKPRRNQPTPPPPAPMTTADAACHTPTSNVLTGFQRYAQTFVALRSGQLTSASFGLNPSQAGAAFDLEIRAVNAAGTPSTVLASTTIANVPAIGLNDPLRIVSGAFAAPPTVAAGQTYALAVTGLSNMTYLMQAGVNDQCSDGILWLDAQADGTFLPQAGYDLTFTTFVTS